MKKKYISPVISVYTMASMRLLLQASDKFDGRKRHQDIDMLDDDDITSEEDIG